MSWLYRGMKADEDGYPATGESGARLGVRIPDDIPADDQGMVVPNTGGMSVVADDPTKLPGHRRPATLNGTSKFPIFRIAVTAVPDSLAVRQDQPKTYSAHRVIEPAAKMTIGEFRQNIYGTRTSWESI